MPWFDPVKTLQRISSAAAAAALAAADFPADPDGLGDAYAVEEADADAAVAAVRSESAADSD